MHKLPSYIFVALTLSAPLHAENDTPDPGAMPFKLGDPNCNRSMGMGGGSRMSDNSQWSGMPGPGAAVGQPPPVQPENPPNMGSMMGGGYSAPMMGQPPVQPENLPNMGGMMGGYGPMMGRGQPPENSGNNTGMAMGGAPRYGQWGVNQPGMMMPPPGFPPMHPPGGGLEQRLDNIERRLDELMRHLQSSQQPPQQQ